MGSTISRAQKGQCETTTDNRLKYYYCVTTIIYVFFQISVQVFRSNRRLTEDSGEEDKL